MEEKEFQVWNINVRWSQPGERKAEYPKWHEGLREGRIWNGTGFTQSFKEDKTEAEAKTYAEEWWAKRLTELCTKEGIKESEIEDIELTVKYQGKQTWWLRWFEHMSFNRFDNETDAFASFEKFLESKGVQPTYSEFAGFEDERSKYSSMGADQKWRWKYCECEDCKKLNITVIRH